PKPYARSGLLQVFAGEAAADYFKVPPGDARVPDVFGISQYGVVYTGKKAKIAEHGGANPQDLDVPPVVSGDPVGADSEVSGTRVHTTQTAPTIPKLLALEPNALKAVRTEHTRVQPLDS